MGDEAKRDARRGAFPPKAPKSRVVNKPAPLKILIESYVCDESERFAKVF